MAVVTGDRYLDLLARFIEANAGSLLDGSLVLKLNPVGLHYVQTRLDQLQELEALRAGAPVDYLRAYVADLGDHRALEQLRRVLRLLGSVKVVSMLPSPARDPSPITLLPFARLKCLELRGCDLSTSSARGLLELRPILEKLICYNSADALKHIFAGRTAEIQGAQVWSRLSSISCSGNGMLLMDESLQLLPVVEALDLSRNRFAKVANMQKSAKLKFLDVGFNHITSVANLHQILLGVTKLVLRNNALVSLRGLERIASLEALDLSHNLISNFREVELLNQLPCLYSLWFVGNPITFSHHYRKEALSYFNDPKKLVLDGRHTGRREVWAVRKIVINRQKQRSKYGAFTPAQTPEASTMSLTISDSGDVSDTSTTSVNNGHGPVAKARKKYSRLASIQDLSGQLAPPRAGDCSRQGSVDSDSGVQDAPEDKEHIEETVLDLMHQAEALRREGSSTWLKDLNSLLENESPLKKAQCLNSLVEKGGEADQQNTQWQRRRRRSLKKGLSASNSMSRDSASSAQLDEQDGAEENSVTRSQGGSTGSSRRMSKEAFAEYFSGWELDENYLGDADDNLRISLVDGNRIHQLPSDGGDLFVDNLAETFRLTEELISGKMSVGSPSSPPQFNQDLLHRRQDLERELLQLPLEPEITPFYDSETSSETTYSQLSDSSESLHHSPPPSVRHPFTIVHEPRDFEQKRSEGNADSKHSRDSGPSASGEIGNSGDDPNSVNKGEDGDVCKENRNENRQPEQIVSGLPPPKPKPARRIIRLDSLSIDGGAEGLQRHVSSHYLRRSSSLHRRSNSLGVGTADGPELTRSLSSSIEYPNPSGLTSISCSDVSRNASIEGAEDSQPKPSENGNQGVSASYTLQKVGSLERSDSSPQFCRLHSMVGPFVDPCA
ncbi:hypothetical protein Mapa_004936 [Marchantia paleacea]|nr:hypothetical protein Mapa_004936 [Marchantia paleacea]